MTHEEKLERLYMDMENAQSEYDYHEREADSWENEIILLQKEIEELENTDD